jgi:uncharacterized protein YkwD
MTTETACSKRFPKHLPPLLLSAALSLVLALFATVLMPAAARAGSSGEFIADTNSARANNGLESYAVASDLTSIAQQHAASMARSRSIYHNSSLGSDVCCWQSIGENVGEGSNESAIQSAFMNSSSHRANILSAAFTQIGVGTAYDSSGTLYVDEVFRQPSGSSGSRHVSTSHYSYSAPTHHRTTASRTVGYGYRPRVVSVRYKLFALLVRRLHVVARQHGHPRDPVAAAYTFSRTMTVLSH